MRNEEELSYGELTRRMRAERERLDDAKRVPSRDDWAMLLHELRQIRWTLERLERVTSVRQS